MFIRTALLTVAMTLGAAAAPAFAKATFTPMEFKPQSGQPVAAEKGEFTVPENRSKPGSRTITIRFVRFKSTASKPGPPIVYLAGGPGGSGIGAATSSRFALFMALREFGDVIAYDQRGINESGGADMRCEAQYLVNPAEPLDRAKYGAVLAGEIRKCAEGLRAKGIDPGAYNTRENAADLEDLRKALGAEKLILWGISYGTHLAIATARYHPNTIDRMILAGIEGPDDTYKLPGDQQTLMEEIARLAALDGKHPDLLGAINRLNRELEARPKSVSLTHPLNGQTATFVFGKTDLQQALSAMLFGPDSFAGMPDFVSRLERGDWTALALMAAPQRMGGAQSAMSIAMDCASGITAARRTRIAEEASRTHLGDAINMPFPEVCAGIEVPDAGDAFRGPLISNIPALLISGTLDGRTRPRQAEELRMGMPNAEHLVIENAGHSDPLFLSTLKILDAMKAFLRGQPLRDRYLTIPPPRFLPVRKVATVSDDVLARYAGNYRIDAQNVRRVIKAGSMLYTHREGSQPFAIRPSSETEFFYETQPSTIRFEVKDGKAVAMIFKGPDGVEQRAVKE
jgi:pimeloyl-ACP methyl ester carboxylesterase